MNLKIGLQRSGKLANGSTELLRKCGIGFSNGLGKLRTEAADFSLEIFFLRNDDILDYVAGGVADVGIVGENILAEGPKQVDVAERLGFGRCRLSIAVPKTFGYRELGDLAGRRIARTTLLVAESNCFAVLGHSWAANNKPLDAALAVARM